MSTKAKPLTDKQIKFESKTKCELYEKIIIGHLNSVAEGNERDVDFKKLLDSIETEIKNLRRVYLT